MNPAMVTGVMFAGTVPLAPEAGGPALLQGLVGVIVFVEKIGARQNREDTLVPPR